MKPIRLQAYKPNGKPHMSWSTEFFAQSGEWILTHTPQATSVRHHTKDLTYIMQHSCFGIFNMKEFYNSFIDLNVDGSFKMLYINIATPAVLQNDVISWTDLELDIVRQRGKLAEIIDEDEFEEAKAAGVLSLELANKAKEVTADLIKIVDKGNFPFLAANRDEVACILAGRFGIDLSYLTHESTIPSVES